MKKVKLLVCYHKPDHLLKDEVFTPIHLGRAIAKQTMEETNPNLKWLLDNMIGDDTGDNISLKNKSYNELTSLYWAWKNYDKLDNPDFIGLVHYRRHFVFTDKNEINVYNSHEMGENYFQELNYTPEHLSELMSTCDFACHLGKVDGIYKHYLENHRLSDMELALNILKKQYPEMGDLADEYMAQNVGNFCNMFIFPKDIFFDYCEYIFGILQEFEETVDTSEKRFFISERLTGIFIYNLIKSGKKYRVFPINFVAEPIKIPVALPLNPDNSAATVITILSMLCNADLTTTFDIYLMHNQEISEKIKNGLNKIKEQYKNCTFTLIESELDEQYFPIELSERVPNLKKCLYLTHKFIVMHDLAEFFRTCSVDDFYLTGLPMFDFDLYATNKAVRSDTLMLNCERMRKYEIYHKAKSDIDNGTRASRIINSLCKNQIGYYPSWFTTITGNLPTQKLFTSTKKTRSQYQEEATWRPLMYYSDIEPWINIQGIYSIFWWNLIECVPVNFSIQKIDKNIITNLLNIQQKELNHAGMAIQYNWKNDTYNYEIPLMSELKQPAEISTVEPTTVARNISIAEQSVVQEQTSPVEINDELAKQRDFYASELEKTRTSMTYKIGNAITYLPKKLRKKGK